MAHTQAYSICSTSRSGTTLLCDLLTDTNVAGAPDSFFRLQSMQSWWASHFGIDASHWPTPSAFDAQYLQAALQQGTGATNTFGMRLMWDQVDNLVQQLRHLYGAQGKPRQQLEHAFGSLKFIHLTRQDKVAQAISRIRAEASGLWHLNADGSERERVKTGETPQYNAQRIATQRHAYHAADAAWQTWFANQQIVPLEVTYEALSTDPIAVVRSILRFLALDAAAANALAPRTMKLADAISVTWATRFRAEYQHHD